MISLLPILEKELLGHMVHVASEISEYSMEYLPLAHNEQRAVPFTSLYLPGAHAEQLPPSGPVKP